MGTAGLIFWVNLAAVRAADNVASREGLDFFETRIRPILAEQCYQCHSATAEKLKGGLLLDSRAGLLKGGESGPALVPGDPEKSLLIKAVRYRDQDFQMPPKRKLSEGQVADLERWVRLGAPDPRTGDAVVVKKQTGLSLEEGRKFWAYQLPKKTAAPELKDKAWPHNEIDRFILAGLEAQGLHPVADADKATLIRRACYDLLGLPPTPEQIDEFVNDPAADAFARLVDRLLASPHFGERWGRHWLDVARYAESVTLRGLVFKEAWRYRDYVIETFNLDRPFNRFVQEQIAGDLLPAETLEQRQRQLVATSFLVFGNTNLEEQDKNQLRMDVVDEQLDTLGKAFLAQTIGCARCHDHKFDPIPTRDYYALAGILRSVKTLTNANVSAWLEFPLPVGPAAEDQFRKIEAQVAELQARIKAAKDIAKLAANQTGMAAAPGVVVAADLPGVVVDDTQAKRVGEWKHSTFSKNYVGEGYLYDEDRDKGAKTLTFLPELPRAGKYEVRLAYVPATNRATNVPVTIFSADGETTVRLNERETPAVDGRFVSLGQYRFEQNGQGFVIVANEGTKGHVVADAVQFIPLEMLDAALAKTEGKPHSGENEAARVKAPNELKQWEAQLKELTESAPKRPKYMSVTEAEDMGDTRIHVRGNVHNLTDTVPRGFLQVAWQGAALAIPASESGRRQLAEWLASPENPLTARVMANRAWHWLFGTGLVRTTDNFGTTGERPSHPELLDYLAVRFVEEGWSVKRLVREIMLSRTYQLSSNPQSATGDPQSPDPENRLFRHANRRRLDAECIRDTMLFVSGQLQSEMGGSTIKPGTTADYGYRQTSPRRSVYEPVLRNSLPELFEVFDFADPSMVTGRRNVSTVAPQALFLMNHPFVMEQSRHAALKTLAGLGDEEARIQRAYRETLGRLPTEGERALARKFLTPEPGEGDDSLRRQEAWARFYQALFASLDFRHLN